eukprot:s4106_g7.t1
MAVADACLRMLQWCGIQSLLEARVASRQLKTAVSQACMTALLFAEMCQSVEGPVDESPRWAREGRTLHEYYFSAPVPSAVMPDAVAVHTEIPAVLATHPCTRVSRASGVRRSGPRSDSSHAMAATPMALRALAEVAMGNLTPEGQDYLRASLLSYEENRCSEEALARMLQMLLRRPEHRRRISYAPPCQQPTPQVYAPPCQQPTPQVADAAIWPAGDGTLSRGHVTAFTKILCSWPFSGADLCPLACTCRDLSTMAPSNHLYRKHRHFVCNQDAWITARTTVEEMDAFVERCYSLFGCALAQERLECFACGRLRDEDDGKTMASVVELCQQCFAAFRLESTTGLRAAFWPAQLVGA